VSDFNVEEPGGAGGDGGVAIIASNLTQTGETVTLTGAGDITVNTAAGPTIRVSGTDTGSVFPLGNTQGTTNSIPLGGQFALAGGANISLSMHSDSTSRMTIVGGGGAGGIATISASDATFTGPGVRITGSNAATVRSSGANTVVIDAPTQTVQSQSNIQSIAASDTTYHTGQVQFTGSNIVTVRSSANQRVVVDASVSNPPSSLSPLGNTTGTTNAIPMSATWGLAGGNRITISGHSDSSRQLTISGPNDTGSAIAVGNTAGTTNSVPMSGQWALAGGPNITLSMHSDSTSRVSISAGAGAGGITALSASDTAFTGAGVRLTGSNMITVKSSGVNTVVFDATQSAETGQLRSVSISNNASTSGALANISSGALSLVAGPNITLSQDANTVAVSAAGPGAALGVSALGASDTTYTSGKVDFTGGNNITVQSSAGQQIKISAPNTTSETQWNIANYSNMDPADVRAISHASVLSGIPMFWPDVVPGNITLNSVAFQVSHVNTSTLQSFSVQLGVYTQVNSTSMALLGSASDAFVYSTASSVSWSGVRDIVLTSPGTHTAISTLSAGQYVFGLNLSVAATGSMNFSLRGQSTAGPTLGNIKPATNVFSTATSQGAIPLYGRFSASSAAMPANVAASSIRNQGAATQQVCPFIYIRS
jgi:hypothetical protein